jgi:DNA invertase Pin-like site-specific DNA recombinase
MHHLRKRANCCAFLWFINRCKMKVEKIGYARVSTPHQHLDRQIAALRAEGCTRIFREKVSGRDLKGRPQLAKAIDALPKDRG